MRTLRQSPCGAVVPVPGAIPPIAYLYKSGLDAKAPPSPCQEKWEPVFRPAWRQRMRARKPGGNRMPTVLLTHTPDMLANYYGDRALAALRALCDVRLNDTGKVLDAAALAK